MYDLRRAREVDGERLLKGLSRLWRLAAQEARQRGVGGEEKHAAPDVERLDELQVPIMRAAPTGDPQAITLALALFDRRAHLPANMRANRVPCVKKGDLLTVR